MFYSLKIESTENNENFAIVIAWGQLYVSYHGNNAYLRPPFKLKKNDKISSIPRGIMKFYI